MRSPRRRVGAPDSSYHQYVYVGAGNTTFDWTVTMPDTEGDYEFRLFENYGYNRLATSEAVTVSAAPAGNLDLTVSATAVSAVPNTGGMDGDSGLSFTGIFSLPR